MSRTMTDYVRGGMQSYVLPSMLQPGELEDHAQGRVDTMAEILVQAACLKSAGFANVATSFEGADYQDVKGDYSGISKIAAAHRAMFALYLDGRNMAKLTEVSKRKTLQDHVIAPQARTDLVSRPVNYADQLLEIAASEPVFRLFRSALELQKPGKPVEKALLLSTVERMQRLLHDGFALAADNFHRAMVESDRLIFRPGSMQNPFAGMPDDEFEEELDALFDDVSIQVRGPKNYGALTEVILGTSQQITDHATPEITRAGVLEAMIAEMEALVK